MTRAAMRRILRRRLREVNPDEWQDTDLNEILEEAVKIIQADIVGINPNAFIEIDQQDIVGPIGMTPAIQFYPLPYGCVEELFVEWLDPTSLSYVEIKRGDFFFLKSPEFLASVNSVDFNTSTPPPGQVQPVASTAIEYARVGRYLYISPPPAQSQAKGLQLTFVPTLGFSADTDVPELHPAIHFEILLQAHLMLIGENSEESDSILKAMAPYKAEHVNLYPYSGGLPMALVPQLKKGY